MNKKFTILTAALALLTILAIPIGMWGQDPVTLVSGSGSSGYTVPEGWTTTGTVEGGSYLKIDGGTLTSPEFAAHTGLSFTYTVATFGSGTNHPLTIRILNASTNAVITEMETETPTSSSYVSDDSPLDLGDANVAFKIQLEAPTGKGIRLRNYSVTGTPAGTPTVATPTFSPAAGEVVSGTTVTISCATADATIYYTTNGDTPTASSTEYTGAITVTSAMTIKAIGVKDGYNNSEVAEAAYTTTLPTVATPTFTPAAGAVASGTEVEIACATDGATIYYTTDGTTPTTSSTEYTDVIEVTSAMTIKAVGVKDGYNNSEVAEAAYTVIVPITGYTIDFESDLSTYVDWEMSNMGNSNSSITAHGGSKYGANINAGGSGVSTASITTKATIASPANLTCYVSKTTTNTTASTWYIEVSSDGTDWTEVENRDAKDMTKGTWVEFSADLSSYSDVYVRVRYDGSTAIRAIDDLSIQMASSVATPAFSVAGGTYSDNQSVTISCETDGAAIYYTTDGTDPTSGSTPYSSAISITQTTTLKAIAIKDEASSNVATATYVLKVATPIFSPEAGTYDAAKDVTISCATEGATIYYTLDGSAPTTESTPYTGAINVSENKTIKAIAVKASWENSNVATAAYTIVTVTPADLPLTYTDGKSGITYANGFTSNGLGTDYSGSTITTKLKFDDTGDWVLLKLSAAPKAINYDIKGNGFSGGTFTVQVSENGELFTPLATHTDLGDTQTITLINNNDAVRYIKWVYTEKSSGNVGLGNLHVTADLTIDGNLCIFTDVTVADNVTLGTCTIQPSGHLTIASGTFNVTTSLTNAATSEAWNNLIIKDGAQLKTPDAVKGTIEKAVTGYGTSTNGKYVLLATPATMDACNETGMWPTGDQAAQANIDFYSFDQSYEGAEWRNFKYGYTYFAGPLCMNQGQGYLYANPNDVTLTLQTRGYVSPTSPYEDHPFAATNANINVPMSYNGSKPFAGYNLLGNPFTCNAYINRAYYRMNDAGDAIIAAASATTAIKPCEGIFVLAADGDDNSVTFSTTVPSGAAPANVVINLKESEMVRDRAIVSFGNERNMPRFQFNEAAAKLYIPQGEKEMAKVNSEAQGEMPVNFKADKNGSYTLSIDIEADMDYLHLIDNMTGADVDLLANPSYTFDARTSDYASRFRLLFSANTVDDNASTGSATFAYFNGSEWVVNSNGNATLQVVDVMGRVLSSETVNGNHNMNLNLSTGVYMLRLVNGNDVKTQKIVVR